MKYIGSSFIERPQPVVPLPRKNCIRIAKKKSTLTIFMDA